MEESKTSLRSIFNQAIELTASAERTAFLKQACGADAGLLRRVEDLLRAHEKAEGFLDRPALPVAPGTIRLSFTSLEQLGDKIGPYKLLEQIGEGGCGVVYVAEQQEPVHRRVALKVIKLGMDTRQVVARFEAERQALALMDHPNIAKVLDAGATEEGRPYFVMELVKGVRITDYCDRSNLSTSERLSLFIQVCQAIQHAHQKGIIHRDIKPSNILVTLHDGVPVPKVIDFGIAKATSGQRLTDKTLYTAIEQFIGTPAYMSPEQAELSGLDIDTRSDIYALGVLLYELLTGKTPFDAKRLVEAGLDEIRRIIREEEPPRPSTRISTLNADEQTTLAKRRQSEPPKLLGIIRGDLDWIVMKTLEKDRTRRYETANGLAMDIQRYLNEEPVAARPPSIIYKIQKFVRRNKVVVTAAAIVLMALLLGVIVSALEAVHARRAEQAAIEARKGEEKQRRAAEFLAKQEAQQRVRAETGEATARDQLYVTRINLAFRAWEEGDTARMEETLNNLRPESGKEDLRGFEWHYLKRLVHPEAATMETQSNSQVKAIAFAPDGQTLVSAAYVPVYGAKPTNQTEFILWQLADGKQVRSFAGHAGMVNGLSFSPDGKLLASAGFDKLVKIWRVEDAAEVAVLTGHTDQVACVVFSPNGKLLASGSGRPRLGFGAGPGDRFAQPSDNQEEVRLWDVATGKQVRQLAGHRDGVMGIAFSPDGQTLASAGLDSKVSLWDTATGKLKASVNIGKGMLFAIAYSPDGTNVAVGGSDGFLSFWNTASGQIEHVLTGHGQVLSLAFSPDGKTVATGGYDRTVKLWDRTSQLNRETLRSHLNYVWSLAYAHDGSRLATAGWDGAIRVWLTAKPVVCQYFKERTGNALTMDFSKDGKILATASADITLWDPLKLQQIAVLPNTSASESAGVKFSPDGSWLAGIGDNGSLKVWERTNWQERFTVHDLGWHWALAISPDGRTIVTGNRDGGTRNGEVKCWDSHSGQWLCTLPTQTDWITSLEFSPNGRMLVVSGRIPSVPKQLVLQIWDWDVRRLETSFPATFTGPLAFSPDGRFFAISGNNVQFWDAAPPKLRVESRGHSDGVWGEAISPDSRTLATASWDGSVRLWNLRTGLELFALKGFIGPRSFSVAFSPDNHQLVGSGTGGHMVSWQTDEFAEAKALSSQTSATR